MNALVGEIVRSLAELDLGLRGDLQMSEQMDNLLVCLLTGKVRRPPSVCRGCVGAIHVTRLASGAELVAAVGIPIAAEPRGMAR